MKRITPDTVYKGLPCSMVAVGEALGIADRSAVEALRRPELKPDGYLSLRGMNALVRANFAARREDYRRGGRPLLREWARAHKRPAIVCVKGHYVYYDGRDYHSFYWNGGDEVVAAWELEGGLA